MSPEGWEAIKLGSIANKVTSGARDWAKHYSDSGAKFIRMTNLSRDGIHLNLEKLKYVDIKNSSTDGQRTSLQEGDILISITAELGKIGLVPHNLGQSYINQHTALVRLNCSYVSPIYIAYLLSSRPLNYTINRMNDAGAKSGLNLSTVKAIPISLPPLPEQKKIAQILSIWDKAIATVEKLIANSSQKKKALMQQLLTGKKRFPEFDGEWKEVQIKGCADSLDNKRIPLNSEQRSVMKGSIPYWGANGIVDYVNDYIIDEAVVLLAEDGGYFNEFSSREIANISYGKAWVNNHAHILKAKENSTNEWLYYSLVHKNILDFINGGTRAKLNKSDMLLIPILLPSIKEQQKIATVLSSADQEIETWQQELEHLKQEKKALMQQLLTGKRRVKLTP